MRLNTCILFAILISLCLFSTAFAADGEILGVRHPNPSPDGKLVAFSYNGDIWTVPTEGGEASRVTDNVSFESNPVFSPDGRTIAFTSNRYGNGDVFTIPVEGGTPTRLTYHGAFDTVLDFSPDGKKILFSSYRDWRARDLFEVPLTGGMPTKLTVDEQSVSDARYIPGKGIIYNRGAQGTYHKRFKAYGNFELWLLNEAGSSSRLTDWEGNDLWPSVHPDGNRIYWGNERDGIYNVWTMTLDGEKAVQLTHHKKDGVQRPCVSRDGSVITYESEQELWVYNTKTAKSRRAPITIRADQKHVSVEKKVESGNAQELCVSPNGMYVAFTVEGEVFARRTDDAFPKEEDKPKNSQTDAFRVTDTPAREQYLAWTHDNESLVYVSDRDRQQDIYMYSFRTGEETQITDTKGNETATVFSPDGKQLAYIADHRRLTVMDWETRKSRSVYEGFIHHGAYPMDFSWSPDSRWLAIESRTPEWDMDVWVVAADGKTDPVNVTRSPYTENDPVWSPDGKYLVYAGGDWDSRGIYSLRLKPEPDEFETEFLVHEAPKTEDKKDDEKKEENVDKEDEEKKDDKKDKKDKKDENPVEIDWDKIHLRARRISSTRGSNSDPVVGDKSEWVYFFGSPIDKTNMYAVKIDGGDQREVRGGAGRYNFQRVKSKFYFVSSGKLNWYELGDGKVKKTGSLSHRARYHVDRTDRLVQKYGEIWRVLNSSFYDENMHGVDWEGVYQKYLPVVKQMINPEEFYYVVYEMLGELNASHLGAYGDDSFDGQAMRVPSLGFDVLENPEGEGMLVGHVVMDSPATKPETLIEEGEVLLTLNGRPLSWEVNLWNMLDEYQGRQIDFEVRNAEGEVRRVPFRPVSGGYVSNLAYEEWVAKCRQRTDDWSDGRVGYVHIRSMNGSSLERFYREVFCDYLHKEALIIDVRFNGGGNIHEELLDLLDRQQYGWGEYRGDEYVPRPYRKFAGPMVTMMNQNSFSDAEIFPAAFRDVGLGKLVGAPTTGTVIGTSSYRLIDGSSMRVPLGGWFSKDGTNLELKGVEPDIFIEMTPDIVRADEDPQLEAAVELLLKELKQGN